jgi:hypothetical protein
VSLNIWPFAPNIRELLDGVRIGEKTPIACNDQFGGTAPPRIDLGIAAAGNAR